MDGRRRLVLSREQDNMAKEHAELLRAQLAATSLPAIELARRVEADPSLLAGLGDRELVEIVRRAAQPVATLIRLEREIHGLNSEGEGPESERLTARRRVATMSDQQLEAFLLQGA